MKQQVNSSPDKGMSDPLPESFSRDGRALPVNVCRVCAYETDCASEAGGDTKQPGPGDFTLCLKCGELSVFDETMHLVTPTLSQLTALQQNKASWNLLTRAQTLIRRKRPLAHKE
jgi:hypothetical protein